MRTALATLTLLLALTARADEPAWEVVLKGPVTIKNRAIPGTPLKEIEAEGDIGAPLEDVQDALLNTSRLASFMPYMKASRELTERDAENSKYLYTLIDLPVVGQRDYVVRVWVLEARANGTGEFRQKWEAVPSYLPERESIRRIKVNNGSWHITAINENSCHAVYRFSVDPGGWVPAFAINLANQQGVAPTFTTLQKEGLKRRAERLAAAYPDRTFYVLHSGRRFGKPERAR